MVIIGWHSFDAIASTPEAPDRVSSGVSGRLIEGTASWHEGGSNDGIYGDSDVIYPPNGISVPDSGPTGDGHARVRPRIPTANGFLQLEITNNRNYALPLHYLFFDMAEALNLNPGLDLRLEVYFGSTLGVAAGGPNDGQNVHIGNADTTTGTNSGDYSDFTDFSFDLAGLSIGKGNTAYFTFWYPGGQPQFSLRLDNIAVTAIPEPGSLLALGGVIGAGLFIRRRNRR